MWKRPETGNQPSVSEQNSVNRSASQNTGIEKPSKAMALIKLSCHLWRVIPAIIPTGMPTISAKPKARMHSSIVAGKTSFNCSAIG